MACMCGMHVHASGQPQKTRERVPCCRLLFSLTPVVSLQALRRAVAWVACPNNTCKENSSIKRPLRCGFCSTSRSACGAALASACCALPELRTAIPAGTTGLLSQPVPCSLL